MHAARENNVRLMDFLQSIAVRDVAGTPLHCENLR
jgi:hypothetical protein